jgi:hypothetical protein
MRIQYIEPLSKAISRTKRALLNPFDLKAWFVIGFTAFLARLADIGFPGGLGLRRRSNFDLKEILYFPQRAWEWLGNHPGWAIAIMIGVSLAFVFGIIITWLSSRGKFMFLDNVVHSRSRIVEPWYEYKNEGNSFFLWNVFWGIIATAIIIAYLFYCFTALQSVYGSSGNGRMLIVPAVLAGLGLIIISIINLFIYVLLRDFVVPIMYRDRSTAWEAIQKFLSLFLAQFFYFIGYGLFLFCLAILIIIGIIIAGCVTCCIGFVILAIPYINAVILLPVSYAMRSFSIEFLEQFGPEYHVFPRPAVNPPGAGSITV